MDAAVLIFDGDCGFCTSSVNFARRYVPIRAVVTPWQRADLAALGVDREQAEAAVLWIAPNGDVLAGPDAVAALLRDAGGWWRPVGAALSSRPLRSVAWPVYRFIARNRHHLPGGTPACAIRPDGPVSDNPHSE